MGDIRERIEGTASEFARQVDDDESALTADDPLDEPISIEDDVNDLEAALNPDEQNIEQPPLQDDRVATLEQEEGRAGD